MLDESLFDMPVCFVDVETTGASFGYGDRVVELGILRFEGGKVVEKFERMVDPARAMSRGAAAVTGITPQMLQGQPSFCELWPQACRLLSGSILVGHNVRFDISFLAGECTKSGQTLVDAIGDLHVIDTVRLARRQLGRGGNGLQRLAARFGYVADARAHRALADCYTTAFVMQTLLEPHGGWQLKLARVHELQGGVTTLQQCTRPKPSPVTDELADSLLIGRPVRIVYRDVADKCSDRLVTPQFVRRSRGHLTLIAHCHERGERRNFRLDRIAAVRPVDGQIEEGSELNPDDRAASREPPAEEFSLPAYSAADGL